MNRRVLISVVIVFALVVGAGGVLYAFGTPEQPSSPTAVGMDAPYAEPAAPSATGVSGSSGAPEQSAAEPAADVPAPDSASPLAIEIPGCRCHSDDQELVAQHAEYRMNQCAGCHAGRVPTGTE